MKKIIIVVLLLLLSACSNKTFRIKEITYDGPLLSEEYLKINEISNKSYGTGHTFEVTLKYSYDGDTAHFNLPDGYDEIYKSTSFRFFNIDTKEIGENIEKWGKTAEEYTRNILVNSYSILLQNDPGNTLIDNYNRGLAWIWIKESKDSDYELLNYKIVQQGLGEVKYLYGAGEKLFYNDISYTDYIRNAQDDAKENNRGMFGTQLDPNWIY